MRILLLGEFSGFHKNLKQGLIELGHNVVIASKGDGWKSIKPDIFLPDDPVGMIGNLRYRIDYIRKLYNFKGYDIVQLVNPFLFPMSKFPTNYTIEFLSKENSKTYLSAAGSDSFFWIYGRKLLKYGPFDDFLKYDIKAKSDPRESNKWLEYNKYVANKCAGIIPVMYEYEVSYMNHPNLKNTIPLPINTDNIPYQSNVVNKKLVIFHGLNRYGFKGTRHVEEAFNYLSNKYPNQVELIIDGQMPLDRYLEIMRKANVVIDQTNSYSCGLNAIYALAMGKVVLGGAEPESLLSLGVNKSPVINVTPNSNSIIEKIEYLLECKSDLERIGYESRVFAEKVHGHRKIAEMYINTWQQA